MAKFQIRYFDDFDYNGAVDLSLYERLQPEWAKRYKFEGMTALGGLQFKISTAHRMWREKAGADKARWATKVRTLTMLLEELTAEN